MMMAFFDLPRPASASARKISAIDRPPMAKPPILRKFLRVIPSQKRFSLPAIVSMAKILGRQMLV